MAKTKVLILGSTGMLGSMLVDFFSRQDNYLISATYRNDKEARKLKKVYPKVNFMKFDAENASLKKIFEIMKDSKWVINAIGVIKPYIHDDDAAQTHRAISVNARFPHLLGLTAEKTGSKIIQIATDCVYSGAKGHYSEIDAHDALDVYGKTKSLGETFSNKIYHLRCSIIGPEIKGHNSLLDWFLGQPKKTQLNGFANHSWNGVTSLHYAKICQGIIDSKIKLPHIHHLVPGNSVSKASLLKIFAKEFERQDLKINDIDAQARIDRTLATQNNDLNLKIWQAGGYSKPPLIGQMVKELANYNMKLETV